MTIRIIRMFFIVMSAVSGYYLGSDFTGLYSQKALMGAGIGTGISLFIMLIEAKMKGVSLRNLSAAAFGLIFGFFMAWMMTLIVQLVPMDEMFYSLSRIIFTLVFCYLGMVIAIKGKDEFNVIIPYVKFSRDDQRDLVYLLDTSVIIDGRISAICETHFLEGKLVVPRFVLHELQQVADSSDDERRNRGRRGLDMLERLKKIHGIEVIIHDERLPEIKEVDAKLVRLAKILDAPVLTTDFNLNKVAKLEGVDVLNINDLANAMRPVVFPGERMTVHIKKEGKERNQGVAFMDDGTMIVIDNAKRAIGKNAAVTITSVLQTSAGRMIFASLIESPGENAPNGREQRPRENTQRRPRDNRQQRPRDNRQQRPRENTPEQKPAENTQQQPPENTQQQQGGEQQGEIK